MLTPIFELRANGICYAEVTGSAKDVQNQFVNPDKEIYGNVTKTQIGFQVLFGCKVKNFYFKNLTLSTESELKTLKFPMIKAVITQNFDNDNTTYFMLERGLVLECRKQLSDKGKELLLIWNS